VHERLDPESVRRVMEAYYTALRAAVEDHGGTVVKLLGDGVLALSTRRSATSRRRSARPN
jgi:class 3 adenylate cyclase